MLFNVNTPFIVSLSLMYFWSTLITNCSWMNYPKPHKLYLLDFFHMKQFKSQKPSSLSAVFQPFSSKNKSVSLRVLRLREAIKLQFPLQWVTYSQSVSPVSPILSQPIDSAYLCLPRGDGRPCALETRSHTQTQCMFYSGSSHGSLTQHICLYGGAEEHQSFSLTFHLLQYTGSMHSCSQYPHLHPQVCVCSCRGGFNLNYTVVQEVISRKKEKETDLKRDNSVCVCVCADKSPSRPPHHCKLCYDSAKKATLLQNRK